jgi:hypothetical protein
MTTQSQVPVGAVYELWIDGGAQGPFNAREVMAMLGNDRVTGQTHCCRPGMDWAPLSQFVPEIDRVIDQDKPPVAPSEFYVLIQDEPQGPFTVARCGPCGCQAG